MIKQDGVFVCQSCGCKYSVEDAKKLMVEGTVKIDTSDELKNLYEVARRAKEAKNNENVAKYYDMILIKDPSSWEANFYTVFFQAMSCRIAEITSAATAVNNCIGSTFVLIRDNITDGEERKTAIKEVKESAYNISDMLYNAASNHYENIDGSIKSNYFMEFLGNTIAAAGIKGEVCSKLCDCFIDDKDVFTSVATKILKDRIAEGIGEQFVEQYAKAISKYEPEYEPPKKETSSTKKEVITTSQSFSTSQSPNASGGCQRTS